MEAVALLYVTTPSREVAGSVARILVEEKLAACVNILGDIHSIYRWQGTVEDAQEVAMLIKTSAACAQTTIGRIKQLHPYTCPAILSIPVNGGFEPFLEWVTQETRS